MRLSVLLPAAIAMMFCQGCSQNGDTLPNRVAITVTVRIDGEVAGDGSLALRPETGVKCPLIKMAVIDGVGHLGATEGPVPGQYMATFRPSTGAGDITTQLSKAGRSPANSARSIIPSEPAAGAETVKLPRGPILLTVPDNSGAAVDAEFEGT